MTSDRHVISTAPVELDAAVAIETVEAHAWSDLTAAVPPAHAHKIGLEVGEVAGALVLRCSGGGFDRGLFNRPIGFGVFQAVTREAVATLVESYRGAGVGRFIVPVQPHCRPADLVEWLAEAGLDSSGAWDRVVRADGPLASIDRAGREFEIVEVDASTADEWADFLCDVYAVDAGPWLHAVVGRSGWRHFAAREHGRIVAARSMYLPASGFLAFLAIDGPVPGVMTPDHVPDAAICREIVRVGLESGARGFVADIEAPSAGLDTPAYGVFGELGFARPYTRTHYAPR